MSRLNGKVALITGAASGIGAAIATRFIAEGATVVVADVNEKLGRAVAKNFGDSGAFFPLDVRVDDQWQACFRETLQRFGVPSILVNNAGISSAGSVQTLAPEAWRNVMDVNSTGTFLGCRHGVEAMAEAGGAIINISSARAVRASANQIAYCASKAAVNVMTRSVALHCAENGLPIRCNAIAPGVIDSPILDETRLQLGGGAEADAKLAALQPIGRLGTLDEIASAAVFLASQEASFITGETLIVDGGFSIRDR